MLSWSTKIGLFLLNNFNFPLHLTSLFVRASGAPVSVKVDVASNDQLCGEEMSLCRLASTTLSRSGLSVTTA